MKPRELGEYTHTRLLLGYRRDDKCSETSYGSITLGCNWLASRVFRMLAVTYFSCVLSNCPQSLPAVFNREHVKQMTRSCLSSFHVFQKIVNMWLAAQLDSEVRCVG